MRFRLNRQNWIIATSLGVALTLSTVPVQAKKTVKASKAETLAPKGVADDQLAPQSRRFVWAGDHALAAGKTAEAITQFEAALAVDPRNRQAYIGLGRAAQADGLPGTAVRYYRSALELDPNDLTALEAQGMALLQRGAKGRAEENLARLQTLCATPCPPAARLSSAIDKATTEMAKVEPAPEQPAAEAPAKSVAAAAEDTKPSEGETSAPTPAPAAAPVPAPVSAPVSVPAVSEPQPAPKPADD